MPQQGTVIGVLPAAGAGATGHGARGGAETVRVVANGHTGSSQKIETHANTPPPSSPQRSVASLDPSSRVGAGAESAIQRAKRAAAAAGAALSQGIARRATMRVLQFTAAPPVAGMAIPAGAGAALGSCALY